MKSPVQVIAEKIPKDYYCQISLKAPAQKIYQAITEKNGLQNWWTPDCEVENKVGGQAIFRFDHICKVIQIQKLTPDREVQWVCVKHYSTEEAPSEELNEWVGTKILFQLQEKNPGQTELSFTHQGLTPTLKSYDMGEKGWNHFIKRSLKEYVETGHGQAFQLDD